MRLEHAMRVTSPEFEQAEAHFAALQRRTDFIKAHPEYTALKAAQTQSLDKRDNKGEANELHPLFTGILQRHARPFRARVGKCPSFTTSADQVAYERAYRDFPNQPWGMADGPAMQGYIDAEQAHADALSAQQERRTSDFAELA
jgi:hypothetical protein